MGSESSANRALVTGSGGFIGSHLVEALVERGYAVRALLHYNSASSIGNLRHVPKSVVSGTEVVFGDIRDEHFCQKLTKGIDVVFHLAALIGIPYSYIAPSSYVQTNITGTLNLLNACMQNGVGHFLHTSTSEVYGTALYKPIDEKHPLQGQSPYSASKIGADKIVESYCRSFDLNATTIRPFNTFGPRQSLRAVMPTIITQALASNEVHIGSTHPKRDLTFVLDTVDAYVRAAGRSDLRGETINVGTGKFFSIKEAIETVARILGKELVIVEEQDRIRPDRSEVLELLCDNAKSKTLLEWSPRFTFEQGAERAIDFYRTVPTEDAGYYHV
jgi:NAD dependent epimerase/dehydratase